MFKNHIFLMGALAFTLSALPGISRSAEVGSLSLSSQEACSLDEQLGEGDNAKCDISETVVDGRKIRGSVTARKATRTAKKKWSDTETMVTKAPEEVVEVDVQLETDCSVCAGGVRQSQQRSPIIVTKDQAKDIEAIVRKQFEKEAKALAADAKADAKRQQDVEQCLINEDGTKIEDANDRMSCRIARFESLVDDKQKEKYFDKYIKGDLQTMLSSSSQAQRNQALAQLKNMYPNKGNSVFLKESMDDMAKFGAAHNLADYILQMNPNDPARTPLLGQFAAMNRYFAARGMQVNSSFASVIEPELMTSYQQDLAKYQQELTSIADQHRQQLGITRPTTPGNINPVPVGVGRNGYFNGGGPVGAVPTAPAVTPGVSGRGPIGNLPNAPRAGVPAPVGGAAGGNRVPVPGGFVNR